MAAVSLNFSLRTSARAKTVHLVGSWDNYSKQIPLSSDPAKQGGWRGTFKFPGLRPGSRYWYYYVIDGYHASHDPARESTTEPTTGRKLNILDIPAARGGVPAYPDPAAAAYAAKQARYARQPGAGPDGYQGRSLSPSQIKSPLPSKPYATRGVASEKYSPQMMEQLSQRYARQKLADSASEDSDNSDSEGSSNYSPVPSLSSRSSNSSSPSSLSSGSSCCTCERYAITRTGDRVKLDCGGKRCGYSDSSSDCSSDSDGDKTRIRARPTHAAPATAASHHPGYAAHAAHAQARSQYYAQATRRQGMVVRR